MITNIADLFFVLLEIGTYTACSAYLLKLIPARRESPVWLRGIVWAGYAALSVLVPNLSRDDAATMIVLTAYYLAAGWFLYHRNRSGLIYQLIYMAVLFITQLMAIYATVALSGRFQLGSHVTYYVLSMLKSLLLLGIMAVLRAIIKKRYVNDQRNLKLSGMVLIPVLSVAVAFMYVIGSEVFFLRYGYGWLVVFCIFVLVINLYSLYFWYDVAANNELKHKLELMQRQNELTHQYYEELEANYSRSREIIHDIRNHLNVLEQSTKLEQTQEYIHDVYDMLNSMGLRFFTDNRMLNIVLNDKLRRLAPEQYECNMGGVGFAFMSDLDITTVFANLLDNAVEAMQTCEDREKFWLKIRAGQIQDFTVVKLWNPCGAEDMPERSSKAGHEGLGLENVKKALEKYHGEMEVECKEHIFAVTLVFPKQV